MFTKFNNPHGGPGFWRNVATWLDKGKHLFSVGHRCKTCLAKTQPAVLSTVLLK